MRSVKTHSIDEESHAIRVLRSAREVRAALGLENRKSRTALQRVIETGVTPESGEFQENQVSYSSVNEFSSSHAVLTSRNVFVRATLRPIGRGVPKRNALIAMPCANDLTEMSIKKMKYTGFQERLAPTSKHVSPSRETIGRITFGSFSLVRGEALAIGFLSVRAICKLMAFANSIPGTRGIGKRQFAQQEAVLQVRVLFRNSDSLQYRAAVATIGL